MLLRTLKNQLLGQLEKLQDLDFLALSLPLEEPQELIIIGIT